MRIPATRLAVGFAILLVLAVGARLAVVWLASSADPMRLAVSSAVVVVFVGVPAAYGLRGLLRDDGEGDGDG